MNWIVVVAAWIVCGIAAWGITVADWLAEFENDTVRDVSGLAAGMVLLGPVGLVVSLIASNFCQHGWRLR